MNDNTFEIVFCNSICTYIRQVDASICWRNQNRNVRLVVVSSDEHSSYQIYICFFVNGKLTFLSASLFSSVVILLPWSCEVGTVQKS